MKRSLRWLYLFALIWGQSALANPGVLTFTLAYAKDSSITSISLKNASLKLNIYVYEEPNGYVDVKTDADQRFTVSKDYGPTMALKVLSIDEALKQNIDCHGNAIPGESEVDITCQKAP